MKRLSKRILTLVSVLAIALHPGLVLAGQSDIDLFAGAGQLPPNIMIMLDSSGSMQDPPSSGGALSKIAIAKSALSTLITTINPSDGSGGYTENARFGLFNFRQYGGLLVNPIQSGNTGAVLSGIAGQTAAGGVGTPIDGSILDVARYFNNQEDWGTLQKWGKGGTDPLEPAVTSPFDYTCRDSFVIYISDGLPTFDAMNHTGFHATIGDADGDRGIGEYTTTQTYCCWYSQTIYEDNASAVNDNDFEWGDDITWAMYRRDFAPGIDGLQNVTTHVIGFDVSFDALENMADNGGGNYYQAADATALATALGDATRASFDASASFATAVVPTSRSQFGSALYNVYFEPDAASPFWAGHVEAFAISPTGEIQDRNGNPAVDPATDLLYEPRLPFWDAAAVMKTQGTRTIYTTKNAARIAFASTNIGTGANQIATSDLGLLSSEIGFYPNSGSSTVTTLPLLTVAVIDYLHGKDAFDEDNDSNYGELRENILGDIFHSTPLIAAAPSTNLFGEPGYYDYFLEFYDRDRVIYFGANDGMLHAIHAGNYTLGDDIDTPGVTETVYYDYEELNPPLSGSELFGYVPGLLLDDIKLVPRNNPRTYYFVDGSPVLADVWLPSNASDVSKQEDEWTSALVTGFREGGAGYLALDVTDPEATSGDPHYPYPSLLWEFTDTTLGQAWSDPVITRVKVDDGTSNDNCGIDDGDGDCREHWVMIVGGGYETSTDPNHADFESNPANPGWTDASKSILMVDMASGAVLARVEFDASTNPEMIYGLPSRPAVLDLDFDGFADVVYIGDMGGQVWKWDIRSVGVDSDSDGEVDNWPSAVWFRTQPATIAGVPHYRSFFYAPAAAFDRGKLVLSFASGEREQLRYAGDATASENNRIYVIKDLNPTGSGALTTVYSESDLTDVTNTQMDDDPLDRGFYFEVVDGEKFVSDIAIFAGEVLAVSYLPITGSSDPCEAIGGESALYAFDLSNAEGFFRNVTSTPREGRRASLGGGLASTPRISIAPDPSNDKMYVKTSKGKLLTLDPPGRKGTGSGLIYWKQNF